MGRGLALGFAGRRITADDALVMALPCVSRRLVASMIGLRSLVACCVLPR